jgi:ribosomal 30S subunit maturation factor RimM
MNKKIYNKLIEVAKKGAVVYENDVAKSASMNMSLPHEQREMDRQLDEINNYEREQGHPVLSAVVIQKENHMPNRHFFEFCRDIGLLKSEDEDEFYIKELRNVHVFWASR